MKTLLKSASLIFALAASFSVSAGPTPTLYEYSKTINMNSPACVTEGDFVSCSTTFLNYLGGISPYGKTESAGYVVDANQGTLKSMLVVGTGAGGQIPVNSDFSSLIDNGYATPNNGNFRTATAADPTGGPGTGDSSKSWDIGIQSLLNALTINGTRKDLLIGYDFNETGGVGQATMIWAMATLRDVDGNLAPVNFELNGMSLVGLGTNNPITPNMFPWTNVYGYNTTKTFDGTNATGFNADPGSYDPSKVNLADMTYIAGDICVKSDGTFLPLFAPATTCPSGYTHVSNNLGTNGAEWVSYVPELNDGLENYMAQGYDVLSVQLMIGCFAPTGFGSDFCNDGGYDDVFLMAGNVNYSVPEPAPMALFGLALLGMTLLRRRTH